MNDKKKICIDCLARQECPLTESPELCGVETFKEQAQQYVRIFEEEFDKEEYDPDQLEKAELPLREIGMQAEYSQCSNSVTEIRLSATLDKRTGQLITENSLSAILGNLNDKHREELEQCLIERDQYPTLSKSQRFHDILIWDMSGDKAKELLESDTVPVTWVGHSILFLDKKEYRQIKQEEDMSNDKQKVSTINSPEVRKGEVTQIPKVLVVSYLNGENPLIRALFKDSNDNYRLAFLDRDGDEEETLITKNYHKSIIRVSMWLKDHEEELGKLNDWRLVLERINTDPSIKFDAFSTGLLYQEFFEDPERYKEMCRLSVDREALAKQPELLELVQWLEAEGFNLNPEGQTTELMKKQLRQISAHFRLAPNPKFLRLVKNSKLYKPRIMIEPEQYRNLKRFIEVTDIENKKGIDPKKGMEREALMLIARIYDHLVFRGTDGYYRSFDSSLSMSKETLRYLLGSVGVTPEKH